MSDPIWHVISHSGEVILIINCYIQFTYLLIHLLTYLLTYDTAAATAMYCTNTYCSVQLPKSRTLQGRQRSNVMLYISRFLHDIHSVKYQIFQRFQDI